MMKMKPFDEVTRIVSTLLICIGVVIGVWGTIISVRKFLRV
jgi:cell division transport system permease protein